MKKLFFIAVSLWVCAALSAVLYAQTQSRPVDWIHGMGGSSTSFEEVATYYEGLRPILTPTRHTFITNNGAVAMATDVRAKTGGTNRIAISHSMGGVAVRQVDLWNNTHWAGVVTMGSPLRGARVANSATDGTGTAFIDNATNELMRGPDAGTSAAELVQPFGLLIQTVGLLGKIFSADVAKIANGKIMGAIGLVGTTRDDLQEGSAYMNTVASETSPTPKILIWGSENDPLFWRTVGSMAESTDQAGVDLRDKISNQYTSIADAEYALRFINLPFFGLHNHRANEWSAGRDWLNYHGDTGWAKVIGASGSRQEQVRVSRDICGQTGFDQCMSNPSNSMAYCMDYCEDVRTETQTVYFNNPSDGVVPAPSQRNDGGGWTDYALEAPGVNHREMRRKDNIKNSLDWVFNGGYRYDIFGIKN